MTADGVAIETRLFESITVSEEHLEGLLRTDAPAVFPGYEFYEFKPAVRCGEGTRHPDGALLSRGNAQWWVVEVESHLHSVDEHIEPQLRELAEGHYGPEVFAYLDRHDAFDPDLYRVDPYEPSFLLVIDSATPEVRSAANRTGFEVVECAVFRSEENRYALVISGARPRADRRPKGPGLDLTLEERDELAVLLPADRKRMPRLKSREVLVGDQVKEAVRLSDGSGIVLPLTAEELRAAVGDSDRFRLAATGRLFAISPVTEGN